ncbi:MAG: DUF3549 family protein [Motiliproteus sp.]|nr:DUF3549 family protein [Motiliproteus sp.]
MNNIQTLSDFLRSTDANFRIFDLGRRISKLSQESFQKFEQTETPYPLPFLQQAWIAVLLFNPKQTDQHLIWFLKFPLDEQGMLVQAARDDFLNRIAKTVGNQLLEKSAEQDPLKDNPFSFTPDQEKMAAFHARATSILKQPASSYYEPAREYFSGLRGFEQWDQLGLQGIADFCARLDERGNHSLAEKAISHLPIPPLEALCVNLEHEVPSHGICQALANRVEQLLSDPATSANTLGAVVRGISQCHDAGLRRQTLSKLLESDQGANIELLAAIASRSWKDLEDSDFRRQFMERLAINSAGQQSFNLMVRDLVFMPGMRGPIMESFRDPQRSEALGKAIGAFFGG